MREQMPLAEGILRFYMNEMRSKSEGESTPILEYLGEQAKVDIRGDRFTLTVPLGHSGFDEALVRSASEGHHDGTNWTLTGSLALDLLGELLSGHEQQAQKWEYAARYFHYRQRLPRGDLLERIHVQLLSEQAVVPAKNRVSDSGYDLTVIQERKRYGQVVLYGTDLVIQPPEGYYFDVVARSSIIKSGYMLANNVGVIDRAYRGELMVPLVKLDPNVPDLTLPARIAQLIPRPIVHFPVEIAQDLAYTMRGSGGFGSTG